jgi:uncharacterized protein YbjT (DUF2867 family)
MGLILVTGATGTIGGEIARQLRTLGAPMRMLVRDRSKLPGDSEALDVAVGDFASPDTLDAALDGVEALFLASFDRPNQVDLQRNVLHAAKRNGVRRVVRMSTIGFDELDRLPIFRWHSAGERQLEESGLAFTHLRPSWVMQNFFSFVAGDAIRLPAGEGRIAFVDARDIAAVAVAALTGPGHEGQAYELTGPEALNHAEVAEQLSVATGRSIVFENVSPEDYEREKIAKGWPRESIDTLLALFAVIRAGTNPDSAATETVETVTGRPPRRFRDFARDYSARFGGAS